MSRHPGQPTDDQQDAAAEAFYETEARVDLQSQGHALGSTAKITTGDAPSYHITLSAAQERVAKDWAADDRLWTTQETVEFNLRTFARKVLAEAAPPAPKPSELLREKAQMEGMVASGFYAVDEEVAPPAPRWQPIATAPRDGTRIIVAWANGAVESAQFWTRDGKWNGHSRTNPTHWMPLPAPAVPVVEPREPDVVPLDAPVPDSLVPIPPALRGGTCCCSGGDTSRCPIHQPE